MDDNNLNWWFELKHGGMLISPPVFIEIFGKKLSSPSVYKYKELRENFFKFERWWVNENVTEQKNQPVYDWIDYIFTKFLELPVTNWKKSNELSKDYLVVNILGEKTFPNRGLFYNNNEKPLFLLSFDYNKKIGQGKSKKNYGKFLQMLRKNNTKLGIFTNGMQIRLVYAGLDYDSFVEWEVSNWFEEKAFSNQLNGFFTILGVTGFKERDNYEYPLLDAIELSRSKQGELSETLGEQVRESIEILLEEFSKIKLKEPETIEIIKSNNESEISDELTLNAVYQASVRIIMRIIVILFSEAKGLLPNENSLYINHYGIEGLFEILKNAQKSESSDYLESTYDAWLRILGLFRIIYFGSQLSDLNIPKYGGKLFEPGNVDSIDPVSRALYIFETRINDISNNSLLRILEKLKYGKLKVKHGRGFTIIKGPVDFRELRTEYIGIIYQGILDYELKASKETMIVLNAGLQPILPLSVLEGMQDKQIKELLSKISKEAKVKISVESSEEESDMEENDITEEDEVSETDGLFDEEESVEDNREVDILVQEEEKESYESENYKKALDWTEKAVKILKWVKKPTKNSDLYIYNDKVRKRARSLILKVLKKSDLYLSRWGGTRKGTGTFYTKPQLVVPTVHRTLESLCYKVDDNGNKIPKSPEELLSLKICDISCGSGPFLTASLNYITEVLYESLVYHCDLSNADDYKFKTLPFGLKMETGNDNDYLPLKPDDDNFETLVKAKLKRYVVENCIYGVDINPTAVELAKLSLWIETMDKNLPFEFLDHKIKTGNSLIGAWLDTFQEYPLASWLREGGDASHNTGVNFEKGKWTDSIKKIFNEKVKPEMVELINKRSGALELGFGVSNEDIMKSHNELFNVYYNLNNKTTSMFGIEQKEKIYYDEILKNEAYIRLKEALNMYCALWFWPGDKLESVPTPLKYYNPDGESRIIANYLAEMYHFFHWEIEFPDVFNQYRKGFDSIMGNPPWEISKPNSKEFFTNIDPIYRTYGKQEALTHQRRIFNSNKQIEYDWLIYNSYFKGFSNYVKNSAYPFGDPEESEENSISLKRGNINQTLHKSWRQFREKNKGFIIQAHPYQYQGSADLNLYKLSLEQSFNLAKFEGRVGMIVPSGIYSDKGTKDLRKLFLEENKWEWIFSFENKKQIFDIHKSFKFCINILEKGNSTSEIKTAFMRHNLSDWENAIGIILYDKNIISIFSPFNYGFLEITSKESSDIIKEIYNNSYVIGNEIKHLYSLNYATEYHMTNDSKFFIKRDKLEDNGFSPNIYSVWVQNNNQAFPLYEGRMIDNFDFSEKAWFSGTGRGANWDFIDFQKKKILPQYLIRKVDYYNYNKICSHLFRIGFIKVTAATNTRTGKFSLIPDFPVGESVHIIYFNSLNKIDVSLKFISIFNSFVFDFVLRHRLIGTNLTHYMIDEQPYPKIENNYISILGARLNCISNIFSKEWIALKILYPFLGEYNLFSLWAITIHERLRLLCINDAIASHLFGLSYNDLELILKRDFNDPKGFWRVDKDKPFELRQTILTLQAFKRLKEVGLEEFIKEDWQFPKEIQDKLGTRFLDWQLKGTSEESWAECEFHAKQILGEEGYKEFLENINNPDAYKYKKEKEEDAGKVKDGDNLNLF